jgi:hypothetical protein
MSSSIVPSKAAKYTGNNIMVNDLSGLEIMLSRLAIKKKYQ